MQQKTIELAKYMPKKMQQLQRKVDAYAIEIARRELALHELGRPKSTADESTTTVEEKAVQTVEDAYCRGTAGNAESVLP